MPVAHHLSEVPGTEDTTVAWMGDPALTDAVARLAPGADTSRLHELAELADLADTDKARTWGEQAERHPPVLHTHDRSGERLDEVEYHPAYHQLMRVAVEHGLGGAAWTAPAGSGAHVLRAAGVHLWSQVDAGHVCPLSMTAAAVPALRADPALSAAWTPRLASTDYDFGLRPAADKSGALAGMGLTERTGGSDLSGTSTTAVAAPGGPLEGDHTYRLDGAKWFCSAPMSDVFLVLARAPGGLTAFVVPRVLADGTRNPWRLQRLKDKLGNRSNASSEVELAGTWGARLGEEGRGLAALLPMITSTRVDCVVGSASTVRAALRAAVRHSRGRRAFGDLLVDAPLMSNVLADLAVESHAATLLGMRLAAAVDAGEAQADLARIAVPLAKFWVCKRAPVLVAEALECLGGNGYVEENGLARLFRESPLNSLWEGSGNVVALDVLRAMRRSPAAVDALLAEIGLAAGADARLDAAAAELRGHLSAAAADAARDSSAVAGAARWLVERAAVVLAASLLVRWAPADVADAFVATRLDHSGGSVLGTLPAGAATTRRIVARAVTD